MARRQLGPTPSNPMDALILGSAIQAVAVSTGSEARPTTTAVVFWVGGSTQPTNMVDGDIWLH